MKQILLAILLCVTCSLPAQFKVSAVKVATNDLIYNPFTNKIYVTIPSSNGSNGNSIGIINPATLALEKTIFIGSEPTIMDISDDGQYIYVGFSGSSTVRRFNVNTQTADIQFPLGSDNFSGPFYAYDIAVMPGNPNTIAVSRIVNNSTGFYGVAIYDSGTPRPTTTISTYPNNDSYVIRFINSTTMWGFNNHSTGFDFNKLTVDATGVKEGTNVGSIVNSFSVNDFVYDNTKTKAFFDYGAVIDLSYSLPYTIGTFTGANGRVAYDKFRNLACYATTDNSYSTSSVITFKRYNPNTFLLYDSQVISGYTGQVKHITACGGGCYAFNTGDYVIILKDPTAGTATIYETNKNLEIYPNPAKNQFTIRNDIQIRKLQIIDMAGKVVAEHTNPDNTVQVSEIAKGSYIVKCYDNENACYTTRLMKM
ncbi:MAG TPA: T9SS type A sorting domain-containing protein [Paludibacter sp.]|nr:T9SS type A sorting domain-containing protein [Paludibacter sp.]